MAVLAAVATFAGGGPAGLAGQNAMAGATAAQNEALNNSADHWGKNESEAQREQDALHKQQSKEKAQLGEGSIVDGGDGVSVLSPNPMAFGGAKSSTGPVTAQNFFDGSQYTSKVLNQAASGDYHGFPQSADAFSGDGTVSQIVGGDGVTRWRLAIPGSYNVCDSRTSFHFLERRFRCVVELAAPVGDASSTTRRRCSA
ncbi:hypothetical protein K6W12_09410, partial [Burkholderia multivorans]|nr:hypothetical protein [Burkholderia multivorans]